jgi:hypothetical protein
MGSAGKIDRNHVTLSTEVERLYWETKLGATRVNIWHAVDEVGDDPAAVTKYLGTRPSRGARPTDDEHAG